MSGDAAASPEMQLIRQSCENANARVRFFRVAFGAATPGQQMALAEIRAVLATLSQAGRLRYRWDGVRPPERDEVQLCWLAALCIERALPRGGSIVIEETASGWRIAGQGESVRLAPDLWRLLDSDPPAAVAAGDVQFMLLPDCARQQGMQLRVSDSADAVTLTLTRSI